MSEVADVADTLAELIGFPTHHGPDGQPAGDELALCNHLAPLLAARGADQVEVVSCGRAAGGDGGYVFARWGRPRLIINAHIDTVPANRGWTRDPWTPHVDGERVWGLGAADTKGAIAAALCALDHVRPVDAGVLFSGDEERGTAAVNHFLASPLRADVRQVVVCEPTARRAGTHHRGVLAYRARITGVGGHSSRADHMPAPIVTLARLAIALAELGAARRDHGPPGMRGLCLNVASLDGGVAFNVIPTSAELSWSVRPWPGFDRAEWDATLAATVAAVDPAIEVSTMLDHVPFGAAEPGADELALRERVAGFVDELGGLDFWTEAALYQAAGLAAVVIGPGDIAQAHAADEFVTRADLEWAVELFRHVLEAGRG